MFQKESQENSQFNTKLWVWVKSGVENIKFLVPENLITVGSVNSEHAHPELSAWVEKQTRDAIPWFTVAADKWIAQPPF